MNPFHLNNKTILITGASSGIGRQVAITASEMGATLMLTGRNESRLKETLSLLKGTGHRSIPADLLDENQLKALVDSLPGLDGIVHCAGLVKPFPIKMIGRKQVDETMHTNFQVQVLLMAAITHKRKLNQSASVVFLSSISGQHPHKGGALYAASKAALEAYSKVLALEFQHQKIRSNCICPAMVKTPMYDVAEQGMTKEAMDEHISKYPLGVGLPADVAHAAVFLLSDASRWITGINLNLDGGFLLEK